MAQTNLQKPKITKPKKEGYLEKQSSFWKTYRKRWMVLQGHMLYSFKEEKQYENPTEIFDLRIYNKAKKSTDGKTGQFELSSPNDIRIFCASSQNEMKDWIKHIKAASKLKGNDKVKTNKGKKSETKKKNSNSTASSSKKKNGSVASSKKKGNNNNNKASTKKKTKKSNVPSLSKSNSANSQKSSSKQSKSSKSSKTPKTAKTAKTPTTQKSLAVTNNSIDKYVARMQKKGNRSHSKSRSHGTEIPIPSEITKKSTKKKTKKDSNKNGKNNNHRASVPNLKNPQYQKQLLQAAANGNSKGSSHQKTKSNYLLSDPSGRSERSKSTQSIHKRSVSSMFGRKKQKGFDLPNSHTDTASLTDEEGEGNAAAHKREFNLRMIQTSQSERNLFSQQSAQQKPDKAQTPTYAQSFEYSNNSPFYTVSFETKPFGLTLNPLDESQQLGAVVMVNHNVSDQNIVQGSRIIAINNEACKDYKFERIKNLCRNATLPCIIKFIHATNQIMIGAPHTLTTSVSAQTTPILSTKPNPHLITNAQSINLYNDNAPRASTKSFEATKDTSTATSSTTTSTASTTGNKKKKKNSKSKQSLQAKQAREKKSAKQLMESLGGMNDIKKAEKYEKQKKWKECVDCYEKGIGDLEKSLKTLEVANILSQFQQQQCQQQIDEYCRNLIKIQREHKQEILQSIQKSNNDGDGKSRLKPKLKHDRAASALPKQKKNNKKDKRGSFNASSTANTTTATSSYKENVNENDPDSVFGTKSGKKRESAVALKKKEMARMKREMETGKVEKPNDDESNNKKPDDQEKPEDIYSFLDRSESTKKHKEKMSKESDGKKKGNKKKSKKQKKDKKKKKSTKDDQDDSKTNNDDEDDGDDEDKKKKSKLSKQDAEFRSRLEADIISEAPDVSFKDVQGLANVKLALYETIILPALRPELFTGLRTPTGGLLLFGPPGNGKTMIAKCVAAECESTFFSISASSITSKFVGDAERIMRTLFNLAREKAPSIIFIDEIDSMLTARGGKNEAESSRRIKTEFLIQFDGVKKASESAKRVLVIGATNLPDQLDEAVLRRFGKRIMVPLPDMDTRRGILRLLMSKQKTDISDKEYEDIIKKTNGYSCSDLSTLCKDAAMGPIRSLGAKILEIKNQADMPAIKKIHFDGAVNNVRPSLGEQSLKYFEDWNDKFGSKIHLSMSALPENMRPYTMEELAEKEAQHNNDNDEDDDEEDNESESE